jgi:PAS domain S-box-containing protein
MTGTRRFIETDEQGRGAMQAWSKVSLRTAAEERTADPLPAPTGAAAEELVHELQVHQIELEMQNDELRRTQAALQDSRDRYLDLYEFAPVGYLTLTGSRLIAEANLTAATLFAMERKRLIGQPFTHLVSLEDRERWQNLFNEVSEEQPRQNFELALCRGDQRVFHARVNCRRVDGERSVLHLTLTDISEQKQIEDALLFMLKCGSQYPGEDFFRSLARYLGQSLQADGVVIERCEGEGLAAGRLAVYADGVFLDTVSSRSANPAAGAAPGDGAEHVAEEVKLSRKVLEGSAETRASTLLRDFAGEAIGRIAVSRRKPLSHPRLAELLLKLVAPRAASELLRRKAEYALRESEQQLFGEQALLGENTRLVRQLIAAQERERAELARELHDELSQHLTAIRAFAGAIQRDEAPVRERVQAAAQAIENSARAIYEVSHRLMEGLHPNILDAAGIVEAIASLLDGWGRQHPEIEWRASLPRNLAVDRASLRVAIYRIVQECLSNVSRHAGAQRLRIVLATRQRPEGNWLRLIIRDDGAGMDAGAPRAGFGLLGMRERILSLGGLLKITTPRGGGTRVLVLLPNF